MGKIRESKRELCIRYILFFFLFCIVGWLWEAIVYWIRKDFQISPLQILMEYRGMLHGLWVPIYGVGAVMLSILKRLLSDCRPGIFLAYSMVLCGIVEYAASWILEKSFHARWWDYSGRLLNINGRISIMSVLVFGFAGIIVVYVIEPRFKKILNHFPEKLMAFFAVVLTTLFLVDVVHSIWNPNLGMGVKVL